MENNKELIKAQLGFVLTVHLADKLGEQGLLDSEKTTTQEEKIAMCQKGIEVIKQEVAAAFKPTEEAQAMKVEVEKDLIEHHYAYFGLKAEDFEGSGEPSEITFKAE